MMGEIDFAFCICGLGIVLGWIVGNILLFICTVCIQAYKLLMYLISIFIAQITETKRHRKKRQLN